MTDRERRGRQSTRFLLLYALAVAGGSIAYVPFLTILLPSQVSVLAGSDDVEWVAYATFAGATTASIASILFGWLSDLVRNRQIWIWGGLIASSIILIGFSAVGTLPALIGFVLLWQIGLNMMLSPMAAWAGDCVPDHQKGLLGGLLSFAPALGAIAGAIVTLPGLAGDEQRLWIVAGMVAACVLPVLLIGKPHRFAHLEPSPQLPKEQPIVRPRRQIVARMWLSRMLMQICEAALFAYVLFWFRSVDENLGDDDTAQIFSAVVVIAIPAAMLLGRWADRHDRPIGPLALCAVIASVGLTLMALSSSPPMAIASYAVFGIAASVFLSLHTSQTLRVLPSPEHRGRDMGIFNLTNTTPSLIMPWLVLMLVPILGFPTLLATLSIIAFLASLLLFGADRTV